MLETLKSIDTQLLLFFNHLNNPVLDFIFYWSSDKWIWLPWYAFLAVMVYRSAKKNFPLSLIFIAATIAASDQVASALIKEHVQRFRPCNDPVISSQVHLVNNYCGGSFGFVSSHAANVFALATFLWKILGENYKTLIRILWIWATVVAFSRIYLGAHYPGDVLGGMIVGTLSGYVFSNLYLRIINRKNLNSSLS